MTFAERWSAADGTEVPDGNYDITVADASAFNRRSDGAEFAKLELVVERGEQRGRAFDHFFNLSNRVGLEIARDALSVYGLNTGEVDSWEAFQAAIRELIGVKANVSLSTNGGFREVKVNTSQLPLTEQQAAPSPSPAPAEPVAVDDSDLPF